MLHVANCSEFELYLQNEHFLDHCQQNWIIFTGLIPVDQLILTFDLFTNYKTICHRYIKLCFFLNSYNKWNLLVWFLTPFKTSLNLASLQTILWPQASCIGWQQYEILILGPIPTLKSSNPVYPFSWVNGASFRPYRSHFIIISDEIPLRVGVGLLQVRLTVLGLIWMCFNHFCKYPICMLS